MTEPRWSDEQRWTAVRFDPAGRYQGWCGHRHNLRSRAGDCARILNRAWAGVSAWEVVTVAERVALSAARAAGRRP